MGEYLLGERVLIADDLGPGAVTEMQKYRGTSMTIREAVFGQLDYYRMEEDSGTWRWFPHMIAGSAVEVSGLFDDMEPAPVVQEISFEEMIAGGIPC